MSKGAFRGWVLLSFFLAMASIVSEFATARLLPEELRAFQEREPELTPAFGVIIFVALCLAALYFVSLVGLLVFWRPARLLNLIGSIGGFLLVFFLGPTVATAWTNGFGYLGSAVSGFILALTYYSPVKQYFETPESAAP